MLLENTHELVWYLSQVKKSLKLKSNSEKTIFSKKRFLKFSFAKMPEIGFDDVVVFLI